MKIRPYDKRLQQTWLLSPFLLNATQLNRMLCRDSATVMDPIASATSTVRCSNLGGVRMGRQELPSLAPAKPSDACRCSVDMIVLDVYIITYRSGTDGIDKRHKCTAEPF
jgi:hypothetical protein